MGYDIELLKRLRRGETALSTEVLRFYDLLELTQKRVVFKKGEYFGGTEIAAEPTRNYDTTPDTLLDIISECKPDWLNKPTDLLSYGRVREELSEWNKETEWCEDIQLDLLAGTFFSGGTIAGVGSSVTLPEYVALGVTLGVGIIVGIGSTVLTHKLRTANAKKRITQLESAAAFREFYRLSRELDYIPNKNYGRILQEGLKQ